MVEIEQLRELGREAAMHVVGADAVQEVDVTAGEDSLDRPAYYFSFVIDQSLAEQGAGLVRIRLIQRLLDNLEEQGDTHHPIIRILSRETWAKRANAKSV